MGIRFNEDETRLVAFIRQANWFGEFDQRITFVDQSGAYTNLTLHFVVQPVNDAPEVIRPIGDQRFNEDSGPWQVANLNEVFTDVDGDRLTFSVVQADEPLSAQIDQNGVLTLTAPENFNTAGRDPLVVVVRAEDGQNLMMIARFQVVEVRGGGGRERLFREVNEPQDGVHLLNRDRYWRSVSAPNSPERDDLTDERFTVTILPVNDRPYWVEVPDSVVGNEGEEIRFLVSAYDVDLNYEGDQLRLRLVDDGGVGGRGAQFRDNGDGTGLFTWTPGFEDAGRYQLMFEVSDRQGEAAQQRVLILVGNINRPPRLVEPIPDITMDEDQAETLVAELNRVFADPDGEDLTYEVPDPVGLIARVDEQARLFLTPEPNWNGRTTVVVIARDSSQAAVVDTFAVFVRSINDLPTRFDLVSPRDSAYVSTFPSVRFTWRRSIDVVEDSTVTYSLVLFYGGTRHWYTGLRDTTIRISRVDLSIDPNRPTNIRWWVYANDGIDSIRSNQIFTLFVAPLSVQDDENLLPGELALKPVYPNPFNQEVTIRFDLPQNGWVEIEVLDQQGRSVAVLARQEYRAGRHQVSWNGISQNGTMLPSGIYFCRLRFQNEVRVQRMVLMR